MNKRSQWFYSAVIYVNGRMDSKSSGVFDIDASKTSTEILDYVRNYLAKGQGVTINDIHIIAFNKV